LHHAILFSYLMTQQSVFHDSWNTDCWVIKYENKMAWCK